MREAERVVLVDEAGQPIGSASKAEVHHADTPLHLAFSCYLFDAHGSFLITRRALTKQVWPGVWTNSVCGHPGVDEAIEDAIRRRARFELGIEVADLEVALPAYSYRSPPFRGIVENEFCPVYVGRAASEPDPHPAEVEEFKWVAWDEFAAAAAADDGDRYSWWSKDQLRELADHPLIAAYSRSAAYG